MGQRHWKQLWDPNAKLRFRKRLLINGKWVSYGDPVTPAIRKLIGMNRLRRWWDARVIEIDDFDPAERKTATPVPKDPKGPQKHKGKPKVNKSKQRQLRKAVEGD